HARTGRQALPVDQGQAGARAGPVPGSERGTQAGRFGGRRQPGGGWGAGQPDAAAGEHRTGKGRQLTDTIERLLLIIEDDEAFARTLSRSFERRGYRVLVAASQEEAAALL